MSACSKECDIALVVPTDEEFKVLVGVCRIIESDECDAIHYHTLEVPNSGYRIVAVMLGEMGTTIAGQITEKVLDHVKPKILVLIGIGASIDKSVRLGDVVIADEINEFQAASKTVDKGQSFLFQYSGRHWRTDFALTQFVRDFEFSFRGSYDAWQNSVRAFRDTLGMGREGLSLVREKPEAVIGHVASGTTVVASRAYAVELQGVDRKILAIEMEAAGVFQAASSREHPVRTLVARGISDFADERKTELDSLGDGLWRKYAMYSVVMFLLNLLGLDSFCRMVFEGSGAVPGRSDTDSTARSKDQIMELTSRKTGVLDKSLRRYCLSIIDQYENFYGRAGSRPIVEQLSKLDLKRFFVSLSGRDRDNYQQMDAENLVMEWIEKDDRKGLLVLGDFGTGKSTLSALVVVRLAQRYLKTESRAPLFIPLRNVERISEESLLDLISDTFSTDWGTLLKLSGEGRLVFILDGFDELMRRTDWNKTVSDFQAIVSLLCTKNSKVIVTCRTHYFLKDSEIWSDETSLMERVRATKDFKTVCIEPFSDAQVMEFLKRRIDNPKQIWDQIRSTYNLRDLCKRPLLIDMILSSLPELVASGDTINPASLYDAYTGKWINQEDWRSELKPAQKAALMEEIALDMFTKRGELTIPPHLIREIIGTKLSAKADSKVADYFDYDIRTCSFFNRDSEGNYAFMHKSFLEFFIAKKLSKEISSGHYYSLENVNLSPEIVYFASFMIKPVQREVLWRALYDTRGNPKVVFLGGNAIKLLRALNEDLQGKDFDRCIIRSADFGNLSNCNFDSAELTDVSFERASLSDCSFKRSRLANCRFGRAKLSNVNLSGATLTLTDLGNCQVRAGAMREVRMVQCSLLSTQMVGVDMTGANCKETNAEGTAYGRAEWVSPGVQFSQSCLRSARFEKSNLPLSIFHKSDLQGSSFEECNLRGMCITKCDFGSSRVKKGAISFGAIIDCKCGKTRIIGARLYGTFVQKDMQKAMRFERTHPTRVGRKFHILTRGRDEFGIRADPDLPAFCALDSAVERLSMTDQFEESAIDLYSKAKPSWRFQTSQERTGMMAACLYALSRTSRAPISLRRIADAFQVGNKLINRPYKQMLTAGVITRIPVDPSRLVSMLAKKTKVGRPSVELAKRMIERLGKQVGGRNPFTVAASSLYIACKIRSEELTLRSISKAAGVTEPAVRSVCQILWKGLFPTQAKPEMQSWRSRDTRSLVKEVLRKQVGS